MQRCLPLSPPDLQRVYLVDVGTKPLEPERFHLSLSYSCQSPLIPCPRQPCTMCGVNHQRPLPLPAAVAFRLSSERPLHQPDRQRSTLLRLFKMWGRASFKVQCERQKSCGQPHHTPKGNWMHLELDAMIVVSAVRLHTERKSWWCFQNLMDTLCATASHNTKTLDTHYLHKLLFKKKNPSSI